MAWKWYLGSWFWQLLDTRNPRKMGYLGTPSYHPAIWFGIVHKPSSYWGYPHLWKPPYIQLGSLKEILVAFPRVCWLYINSILFLFFPVAVVIKKHIHPSLFITMCVCDTFLHRCRKNNSNISLFFMRLRSWRWPVTNYAFFPGTESFNPIPRFVRCQHCIPFISLLQCHYDRWLFFVHLHRTPIKIIKLLKCIHILPRQIALKIRHWSTSSCSLHAIKSPCWIVNILPCFCFMFTKTNITGLLAAKTLFVCSLKSAKIRDSFG